MCLVVVSRLDRPPCQIDFRDVLLIDRGLDAGDEALETQDAVQLLGADAGCSLWRGGFSENVRQADHVTPDIGSRDVLIDKLIGRHGDQTTQHPRTQPYPNDRASRWYVVIHRRGQRPEQPRRFAEDTPHLGASRKSTQLRLKVAGAR
jgi:hypothetical protein